MYLRKEDFKHEIHVLFTERVGLDKPLELNKRKVGSSVARNESAAYGKVDLQRNSADEIKQNSYSTAAAAA